MVVFQNDHFHKTRCFINDRSQQPFVTIVKDDFSLMIVSKEKKPT